jgi:hypothetical protein
MTGKQHTSTEILSVDEAWIADWATEGIAALERYLGIQAEFEEYLNDRDPKPLDSDDGDGRTSA